VTPAEALNLYLAIKLHFTRESYDAFKYKFKVKKVDFTKQKAKYLYNKLAKHENPQGLLISNLSVNTGIWVGRLFEQEAKDRYSNWKRYQESQTYLFNEELKTIDHFGFTYTVGSDILPDALKMYLKKKMSLDTITIANDFFHMIPRWDQGGLTGNPVWDEVRFKIKKYRPFITYNREAIKNILKLKFLTSHY